MQNQNYQNFQDESEQSGNPYPANIPVSQPVEMGTYGQNPVPGQGNPHPPPQMVMMAPAPGYAAPPPPQPAMVVPAG